MQFFVACDIDEDMPYLVDLVGDDDHFFIYTDYGHGGGVREAHRFFNERSALVDKSRVKLTSDNARAFYGI
jgi:hypothetical protein